MNRTRNRWFETTAAAVLAFALTPFPAAHAAPALPTGGKVVAGQASIGAPAGGALVVNQSSGKAIINWNGFSIGAGGKVQFDNGSGATLNRVTGAQVSSLDGLLSATGSVYLINPNGVIIGKSGVVNVGGTFVASTLDTSNTGFLAGGPLSFTGPSSAAVVNYGKIGALGGDVALIATRVGNAGAVTAAHGDAGLLAGSKVVLRDASLDDGRFAVELGGAGTSATNSGLIAAADAELRAEGGNVYALAGDTAGVIRATGVKSGGGHVWLTADGGTLEVAGVLEAQGAGGKAGSVETSGRTVGIGAARIDAHGGTWTVDPEDLTIDAAAALTIDNSLNAATSVTEQTTATGTSGAGTVTAASNGDIIVAAPITWTTTAGLTLSAFRDIDVNAVVTASGGGALTLTSNTGGASGAAAGTLNFGALSGQVLFTGVSKAGQPTGALTINGQAYVLVRDLATLASDIAADNAGHYALTGLVDGGNGGAGYGAAPLTSTVQTAFAGTLEGLGNTINDLVVNDTANANVGLFGQIGGSGVVRDLTFTGGAVTGVATASVGTVTGSNAGTIFNVPSDVDVTGGTAGGLAGANSGTIAGTDAELGLYGTGAVTGAVAGGIAGINRGTITDVTLMFGNVNNIGSDAVLGGLVGLNSGTIANAFAQERVDASQNQALGGVAGGLVGRSSGNLVNDLMNDGEVTTGAADGATPSVAGGLAGINSGTISGGSVTNPEVVGGTDAYVGGMVGENASGGSIVNSYATGYPYGSIGAYLSVTGGAGSNAGGLVGYNAGAISDAYAEIAAGDGSAGAASAGGLVGYNAQGGSILNAYAAGGAALGSSTTADGGLVGINAGSVANVWTSDLVGAGASGATGGAVGTNSGTVSDAYYDTGTTGQVTGIGNQADAAAGASGFATGAAYTKSTYSKFKFGTTPGGSSGQTWVIVDLNGSLNNAGGAAGGTRPILLSEYSTTIANAHELQLMALNLSGAYSGSANYADYETEAAVGDSYEPPNPSVVWSGAGFIPVGGNGSGAPFTGSLSNLFVLGLEINDTTNADVGIFGSIGSAGRIVDFSGGASIQAGAQAVAVGGLAGTNAGTISSGNPESQIIAASGAAGGVVGVNSGTITGVPSEASVSGAAAEAGGLVGSNSGTIIASSDIDGATSSVGVAGGLVGTNSGSIVQSSAGGVVMGATDAGGLVGDDAGSIAGSSATGSAVGGADGAVGGLVGSVSAKGSIADSYATADVEGGDGGKAGGLVGSNAGSIMVAYAIGAVTGGGHGLVGGLVAANSGKIDQVYASGAVSGDPTGSGTDTVGGFAASNSGSITAGVYDQTTTGQGVGVPGQLDGTNGVTAVGSGASAYSPSSYPGFSFGTTPGGSAAQAWVIVDADGTLNGANGATRPFLLSEYSTAITTVDQLQLMVLAPSAAYTLPGFVGAGATADYDASDRWSSAGFIPVGTATAPFTGALVGRPGVEGDIGGLTIKASSASNVGLIGVLGTGGVVYNVGLAGFNVTGGSAVGALVGLTQAGSTIIDSLVDDGVVNGVTDVGGLVGRNAGAIQQASVFGFDSQVAVTGMQNVGGVVGTNDGQGSIIGASAGGSDSYYMATGAAVSGENNTGGVVGLNSGLVSGANSLAQVAATGNAAGGVVGDNRGTIIQSSFTPVGPQTVSSSDARVGGLVGLNEAAGTITGGVASGGVTGMGYVGGAVGDNFGAVNMVSADEAVNGPGGTGGLVGVNEGGATITGGSASGAVTGTGANIGGLIGANFGTVASSTASGVVSGQDDAGGLIGYNSGPVSGSSASGPVAGTDYVGGLIGLNYAAVTSSSATASVDGATFVGGLIGWNDNGGSVGGSSATGAVTASSDYAGGLVGVNQGSIDNSTSATGTVSGSKLVGGLVGLNRGTISASGSSVPVSGSLYLGGLVGWNDTGATINTSYATGSVTGNAGQVDGSGNDYVGGLVGVNFGSIANAYATGKVSGVQIVGGLVGANMPGGSSVTTSYATGAVSASKGAVGTTFGVQAGEVSYVYGFPTLSGQPVESGYINAGSSGDGTDLAADQEDGSSAYVGFDFTNTWQSNPDGPPTLLAAPQP